MILIQRALAILAFAGASFAVADHAHDSETTSREKFSQMLDTVDEKALHQVLHAVYPKFKDGVFNRDRTAVEQVHSENPIMASKLVYIAKRQSSNDTTTSTTASLSSTTESTPAVTPSTTAFTSTPADQTSQPGATSSEDAAIGSALSSALSSDLTASTLPSPTTVFIVPSTPASATPIRTDSEGVVFSSSGGLLTLTSSAVNVRFTPVTETNTYYTTLPDGSAETRTSVVVVNAPVTEGASLPSSTTAGLRNGSDRIPNNGLTSLILAALGILAAL